MYCINCGKQVNGNIPVCSDCAMLVIQEQLQSHKLAEKIDIEAQEFSLTNENEPESIPDSIKKHSSFGYSLQFIYLCISRREMRHVEAIFDKEKTGNFI